MRMGSPSGSATMCCSQTFSKSVLGPNIKSISFLSLYCRAVFSERTSFVFTFSRDDPTHLRGGDGLLACDVSTRNFSGRGHTRVTLPPNVAQGGMPREPVLPSRMEKGWSDRTLRSRQASKPKRRDRNMPWLKP